MNNYIAINIDDIIDEYSNYVFKIINNIIEEKLPYQDKEEILYDTFFLLWKHQNNIDSNLKSYLSTIARNLSYQRLRENKINFEYDDNIECCEYDDIISNTYIDEIIGILDDNEKELFDLYYVKGYKVKEIAKLKKKGCSAIKMQIFRMRKRIREVLKNG